MSEILKAKNRILNRSKIIPSSQQPNQQNNDPSPQVNQPNQQAFDPQPTLTYNKKFNISSISMKFIRNEDQQIVERTPNRFDSIKLNVGSQVQNKLYDEKRRQKSPEFSHTQRINPIRHFQPYNFSTLSQSNSQSNLYKWSKSKSRRVQSRIHDEQFQKRSDLRTTLQQQQQYEKYEKRQKLINESPINKIKKTVHTQSLNLLLTRQQNTRAQSPYKPKQCIKQYTQSFVNQIQQQKKSFVDENFPPKLTIIFPRKSLYVSQETLAFQRLAKFYENTDLRVVLMQQCQPTLINPGKYTNPCLYSALRILSEHSQKVLALFENQQKNDQGIYYVRICKDGTWRYVIVDDLVPVRVNNELKTNSLEILGLSSIEDSNGVVELWPSLIEKALAKVYGTYYDLLLSRRDGLCPLLRALTGFPLSKYDLIKDVRSYLVLIDSALKRGHIVVLEEILPEFEYLAELKGLSVEESYQVLQIQKNNFVLRNLADFDLVTKLTFDEVMMFSSLLLFRKEENYTYISQKLRHKKGYFSSLKVKVPTSIQCYWDIWQNNPAYYKNHLQSKIQYEVSPYKIVIQPTKIQSTHQYDSITEPQTIVESGKQITMKKGEYLVMVHLCQSMKQMDFTVSYYGEKDVCVERMKNKTEKWGEKCCWEGEEIEK